MALPIRDGNQSLTTLSTIIVNSAHVPAHSVVSLGSQAITDIAQAVSGVELGPNTISALENISVTFGAGTSITIGNVVSVTGGLTNSELRASAVTIGGGIYIADAQAVIGSSIPPEVIQVGGKSIADSKLYPISVDSNGVQSISGTVTASISGTPSVTFGTAVITGSTSILNFPATQTTTFSAITGSVSVLNLPATQAVTFTQASVTFGTPVVTGSVSVLNFPSTQTIAGTVTANVIGTRSFVDANAVTVSGFLGVGGWDTTSSQYAPIPLADGGTGVKVAFDGENSDPFQVVNHSSGSLAISGTVTANLSESITEPIDSTNATQAIAVHIKDADGNNWGAENIFPVVASGTVTANLTGDAFTDAGAAIAGDEGGGGPLLGVQLGYFDAITDSYLLVKPSQPLPISGTVTANLSKVSFEYGQSTITANGVLIGWESDALGVFRTTSEVNPLPTQVLNSVTIGSLPAISGTVTANLSSGDQSNPLSTYIIEGDNDTRVGNTNPLPISGTVTANNPSGALTTRFGSVTTANTAQITSAVTNTSRKYLLAQNISAGTVTIGIGFSPTTTQGIQLTAGGGLTFDAFCPTGAVYWLGAVTGAAFTILEG